MAILLTPTGELVLDGKVIGQQSGDPETGHVRIQISLDLKLPRDSWLEVFQHFEKALEMSVDRPPPLGSPELRVPSQDDEGDDVPGARQTLLEKWFRADGVFWEFHKSDADPWPSRLHWSRIKPRTHEGAIRLHLQGKKKLY